MIESVFKNEEVLSSEYLPEILPHREEQIKYFSELLTLVLKKKRVPNIFIYGPPGIGKTASIKFVFRKFEEWSDKVKTIYINCWDYRTAFSILVKLANSLEIFVPRRGWGKDEVLERIIEKLKKSNFSLVICLDEVDQAEEEILYDLLRLNQYVSIPVMLIFISNHKDVFVNKEARIKSSLNLEEIEFKPYTLNEMKDILKERMKLAFFDFENACVLLVANYAVKKGGDVRIGLQILLKAGRLAEKENSKKLKVKHVKEVLKEEIGSPKEKLIEEKLNPIEREILEIVKEKEVTSGELYEEIRKKFKISERKLREYVNQLAKRKLLKIEERRAKGYTRIISKF